MVFPNIDLCIENTSGRDTWKLQSVLWLMTNHNIVYHKFRFYNRYDHYNGLNHHVNEFLLSVGDSLKVNKSYEKRWNLLVSDFLQLRLLFYFVGNHIQ